MLAGRLTVPPVEGPVSVRELLRSGSVLVLDAAGTQPLAAAGLGDEVTLAIGPEGGWSAAEKEAAGYRLRTLGSLNLRADTAALAALATALASLPGHTTVPL